MTSTRMKTLMKIRLDIVERWAVGTQPRASSEVKLPILADPRGGEGQPRPYLPVTGLVGSLRSHLDAALAITWLGPDPVEFEKITGTLSSDVGKRRGRLQWLGTLPIDSLMGDRTSTSVDAGRRAAAGTTLRKEQWSEPGLATILALHDGPRDQAIIDGIAAWRPVVGRSRSTGLGRATVVWVRTVTLDLADPAHLEWWLFRRDAWLRGDGGLPTDVHEQECPGASQGDAPLVVFGFKVAEPVHVSSGNREQHQGRDAQGPLRSRRTQNQADGVLTVPGSTWKGVFGHRCDTILALLDVAPEQRRAIRSGLFGSSSVGRGALTFSDSTAKGAKTAVRRHVAIDRFTGGARDSALVTVLSIPAGQQLDLRIGLDQTLPDGAVTAVQGLLAHVARDLNDGLIGIGGHSTRGYGSLSWTSSQPSLRPEPIDVDALVAAFPTRSEEEQ